MIRKYAHHEDEDAAEALQRDERARLDEVRVCAELLDKVSAAYKKSQLLSWKLNILLVEGVNVQ